MSNSKNPECTIDSNKRNGIFNEDWTSLLKCAQFASKGKCFTGYVTTHEELEQVFETFKKVSGISFSTRIPCITETFDGIAQEKFLNSLTRPRLFWKMKVGEPNIPYDKVPFMMYGQMAEFLCSFGPKTRKYTGGLKGKNMIISIPDTIDCVNARECRIPCSAHITIRRILRFPDHKLVVGDTFPGVSVLRKAKNKALEKLEEAICKGTAKTEDRYYISLPTPLAHSNHEYFPSYMTLGSTVTLDPTLNDYLCNLLSKGETDIEQIQTELFQFVQNNLAANKELTKEDLSFYPHRKDIVKHMYLLYKSGRVTSKLLNRHLNDTKRVTPSNSESEPGVINSNSITNNEADADIELTNEHLPQRLHSQPQSPPTQQLHNDIPSKNEFATSHHSIIHKNISTDSTDNMELPKCPKDSPHNQSNLESMKEASLASEEVRNLLKLIEYQTYICTDAVCLKSLSGQLNSIASSFSLKLSGTEQIPNPGQKQHSLSPAPSKASTPKKT